MSSPNANVGDPWIPVLHTSGGRARRPCGGPAYNRGNDAAMKVFLLAVVTLVAALSLAACAGKDPFPIGKGKAPPPPIVTKG